MKIRLKTSLFVLRLFAQIGALANVVLWGMIFYGYATGELKTNLTPAVAAWVILIFIGSVVAAAVIWIENEHKIAQKDSE